MQNAVHREENGIDLQNNNSQTDSEDGDDEESEADFSGSEQAQIWREAKGKFPAWDTTPQVNYHVSICITSFLISPWF